MSILLSCFRRSSDSLLGGSSKDEVKDEEKTDKTHYNSIVPEILSRALKFVSDQSSDFAKKYSEYSEMQGSKLSYGYFDWPSEIPDVDASTDKSKFDKKQDKISLAHLSQNQVSHTLALSCCVCATFLTHPHLPSTVENDFQTKFGRFIAVSL
jgi:hypothetical protein